MRVGSDLERAAIISHFGSCLVATLHTDLGPDDHAEFRASLSAAVRRSRPRGVVLDVSALALLDGVDFAELRMTMATVRLLGARPVLVGLSPAVIAALVVHDVDVDGVDAELTLEAGLARVAEGG